MPSCQRIASGGPSEPLWHEQRGHRNGVCALGPRRADGDVGGVDRAAAHVHVDGTVGGKRVLGKAKVGDWSIVSQELRLDLDDGRWTLEIENDLLVVTDPEGRRTELARF